MPVLRHRAIACLGALTLGSLLSQSVGWNLSPFVLSPFVALQVFAMSPTRLDAATIQEKVKTLPGWTTDGQALHTTRKFKDFIEAIAFVNRLVEPAEAAGHHPDIAISYNTVTITLTTHDAGGLTELDFQMAQTISGLD